MNKVIEQSVHDNLEVVPSIYEGLKITQKTLNRIDIVIVDTKGAAELIKVLQEWVDNESQVLGYCFYCVEYFGCYCKFILQ